MSKSSDQSWLCLQLKLCHVNDTLVALNLWLSLGAEPRLAWAADVWGCDLWLGRSKMSAESIPSWKTVCLGLKLCVCQKRRKQRLILLPALMWATICGSVWVIAFFITRLMCFNHSYCITKDVPWSFNQTHFLNKVLHFKEHPNSSRHKRSVRRAGLF